MLSELLVGGWSGPGPEEPGIAISNSSPFAGTRTTEEGIKIYNCELFNLRNLT